MSPANKKRARVKPEQCDTEPEHPSERVRRDWMGMLLPIFTTIALSVISNVAVAIWSGATFKAQVNTIDAHQRVQDAAIKENSDALHTILNRLPIDYMPRVEIVENRERKKELREREDQRMDAIESKLDRLLERSSGHRGHENYHGFPNPVRTRLQYSEQGVLPVGKRQ